MSRFHFVYGVTNMLEYVIEVIIN